MTDSHRTTRAKLAAAARWSPDDRKLANDLRREHKAAMLAEHIERVVDAAPPLTEAQRARLRALLAPVPGRVQLDDTQEAA